MRRRRLIIAVVVLLLLAGVTAAVWKALDWPPPRLILEYGLPPAGGPTGRTKTIDGIEFLEVSEGYYHLTRRIWYDRGDLLGRVGAKIGVAWGTPPKRGPWLDEWVEFPGPIWISRSWRPYVKFGTRPTGFAPSSGDLGLASPQSDATRWCANRSARILGQLRVASYQDTCYVYEVSSAVVPCEKYAWLNYGNGGLLEPVLFGHAWRDFTGTWHEARELMQSGQGEVSGFFLVWIPPPR